MWKRMNKSKDQARDYDRLIKTSLTGHLGEAVRELQRQQTQDHTDAVESSSEAAHSLCCVVEALFVHRLRDSFVEKVSSVFSGDVVRQPAPNFWPLILAFSHRHSIDYLQSSCSWLKTDIGRCRGWVRTVLNDGMLSSYLELLGVEKRLLNDFYDREAFLRDPEHLDIARKLLSGIEQMEFRLAVNSSMLNQWSSTPLLLAGLWAPPTPVINPVHEAVVQGVDAALCFTDEDETLQPVKVANAPRSKPQPTVDEDLAFRLILESDRSIPPNALLPPGDPEPIQWIPPPPKTPSSQASSFKEDSVLAGSVPDPDFLVTHLRPKNSRATSPVPAPAADLSPEDLPVQESAVADKSPARTDAPLRDPSTPLPPKDSPTEDQAETGTNDPPPSQVDPVPDASGQQSNESSINACTFEDLLENYSSVASGNAPQLMRSKTPEWTDLCAPPSLSSALVRNSPLDEGEPDFELIEGQDERYATYCHQLLTINTEIGLLDQNYRCHDCSRPVGLIYGPAKVCGFTGGSYCSDCHADEEAQIPARIFLNGDWSKRKICRSVSEFMTRIQSDPILDTSRFSRNIYSVHREFGALLTLRTRLHHLAAYLLNCRSSEVGEEFRKKLWPREHLFQQMHSYAMGDLPLIQSGQLEQILTRVFQWGRSHVLTCQLCSLKGFVCESCPPEGRQDVIFPFDLESTYRCPICGALFHQKCMDHTKECPRCRRWSQIHQKSCVPESQ